MEALCSSGSALKELPQRRSVISPTLRLSEWAHSSMSLCRSGSPYRENHHWSLCLLRGSPPPQYFPISPPSFPPCLATPAGVFGTPPLWDSPPLSAADTPFFCPHTFISPRLTLPHLPCHVCVRVILGGWCQEFPEIGTSSCRALWPRNDKMVYNILVHYKPFYSGQYRDKVLTKAV